MKYESELFVQDTLDSGIDVGPTFINFGFFPGPMALLKALRLLIFGLLL